MLQVPDKAELFAVLHNTKSQSDANVKRADEGTSHAPAEEMTQSPRRLLLTGSLDTTAKDSERKTMADGTNMMQKTKRMGQLQICLLSLSDAVWSPDGGTVYQDPSK